MSKRRSRSPSRSSSRSRSRSSHSDGSGDEEEEGARLHVADLGMGITKQELENAFDKFGVVREIWVAKSPPCFAFVVFQEKDDALDALKATDGITLCGSRIRVTFARPRTRGRSRRGFDPNMRCYQCGERGHFSRDCPDSKYGYKRPPARYRSSQQGSSSAGRGYEERGYDNRDRGYENRDKGYENRERGYDNRERGYDTRARGYGVRDRGSGYEERGERSYGYERERERRSHRSSRY